MNEDKLQELIWSLAWFPFSNYHHKNVIQILTSTYPETDWTTTLVEFEKAYLSKPGPGSPK